MADKKKSATIFDERIHTLAAFFLESGIAHGQRLVNDKHFGFEKRGHGERQTNCPATWQKTGRNAALPQEGGQALPCAWREG